MLSSHCRPQPPAPAQPTPTPAPIEPPTGNQKVFVVGDTVEYLYDKEWKKNGTLTSVEPLLIAGFSKTWTPTEVRRKPRAAIDTRDYTPTVHTDADTFFEPQGPLAVAQSQRASHADVVQGAVRGAKEALIKRANSTERVFKDNDRDGDVELKGVFNPKARRGSKHELAIEDFVRVFGDQDGDGDVDLYDVNIVLAQKKAEKKQSDMAWMRQHPLLKLNAPASKQTASQSKVSNARAPVPGAAATMQLAASTTRSTTSNASAKKQNTAVLMAASMAAAPSARSTTSKAPAKNQKATVQMVAVAAKHPTSSKSMAISINGKQETAAATLTASNEWTMDHTIY